MLGECRKGHVTRLQNLGAACHVLIYYVLEFPLCMPMSGGTLGNAFALSSLVVVSESGDVLGASTALPSLNAGRVILHVVSGTYSRLVPKTPRKIAGQIAGQSLQKGGEVLISLGKLVPPARFQRATFRLGGGRSMQLSYGSTSE